MAWRILCEIKQNSLVKITYYRFVEKFKLSILFNEVHHAVQHLVEEKDLDLVMVYRKRLYQVVLNVLSNGLK